MLNYKTLLTTLLLMGAASASHSQDISWDRKKFPDYNPVPRIDTKAQQRMLRSIADRRANGQTRPDHWNNALMEAFPPVMNQSAGSCGSASRIYYMFAEEINAARGANGKLAENIYPTHFTWLLTWCSEQGKEVIAQHNGIPNSEVYGGYTYSDIFGYQDCDDGQSNYGWMQGYDKWFHAMHNRISASANFPAVNTEEGRELVKNYLWNHCGDESFSTGGIVGVGVASGGNWQKIPKTTNNDAYGFTGKYYVKNWGTSVDHALTIVGYDDRVEFDLNGNGVKGEADADEVGAWIVVNSWGSGWNNGGFVYCPYAEARPTSTATNYWGPEYYTIRRDYRPLRTLKVTMDYSRRHEIALYVGYSTNLRATKADKEIWLRHFKYAGLGKGVTPSASTPATDIPMLGRWADGELHTEPMEFGYDLTDLVADVDPSKPLKYFLRVETRSYGTGEGHIYNASIVDYAIDSEGVETPFEIAEGGTLIQSKGRKTTVTAIARSENIPAPRNLNITGTTLTWQAPVAPQYAVAQYRIYCDGELLTTVDGSTLQAATQDNGTYTVTAVYNINGTTCESPKSGAAVKFDSASVLTTNNYLTLAEGAQISIPHFNQANTNQFTIEFWLKPSALSSTGDNFGLRSSSGKFFFKVNKDRRLEIGFDGGDYKASTKQLQTDTWQHIALTANNGTLNAFVDGTSFINFSTGWNNTVGSVGNLVIGQTEGTTTQTKSIYTSPWTGSIDELRVWSNTRSATNIKAAMYETYIYPALTANLAYYYKMNTREVNGTTYLIEAVQGNDATISNPAAVSPGSETTGSEGSIAFAPKASTDFTLSTSTTVGQPVTPVSKSAPGTCAWAWTFTGADITASDAASPVVVFNQTGTQTVKLTTTNINGETTEKEKTITVNAVDAPQADFTVSKAEIAAGEHVSFINASTPLDDCTYEWSLPGSDKESARTVNVAVTYPATGTYTVRLTATNSAGSNTVEKQIQVVKVAPQSAFSIHNNVAVVGEDVTLIDETRYEPEAWEWMVASTSHTYYVKGRNATFPITSPGIYSVSLKTSNEIGTSTTERSRAITVCAYDGETGLKFDDTDDEVVFPSPFGENTASVFTIDFWMYPGTLSENGIAIGDSGDTFLVTTGLDGSMTVSVKGKTVTSIGGLVTPNEWHHYAITFTRGTVRFYRDASGYGSSEKLSNVTSSPAWNAFRLGGSAGPMNAIIDELRVWKRALTDALIKEYANAPISEPAANTDLVLYADFNQSSGNVIDKSASGLTGQRSNFGPDGDAWTSSRGIFYLNFEDAADVTSRYLKNYKASFATASGTVNPASTSRFKRLQTGTTASPWVQENSVVADGITTEFYVDGNKNNYLTLSTKWDGFADQVSNLKLYQTVQLPAGSYEFYALTDRTSEWVPSQTKSVAALGTGMPDFDASGSEVLAASYCGIATKFILTEPATVSLGLVSNQKGQACHTISQFYLLSSGFTVINGGDDAIEAVSTDSWTAPTLQATGGLGCIQLTVSEPQYVTVHTLSGQLLWASFVENDANVRVPSGIYVVGGRKIIVK